MDTKTFTLFALILTLWLAVIKIGNILQKNIEGVFKIAQQNELLIRENMTKCIIEEN